MEKTYILLRSNKQQGPYTLAQLAKMELQRDDLIHVQHGVAGWQYAEEIEVLKPYFSAAPAPAYAPASVKGIPTPLPASPATGKKKAEPISKGVFAIIPEPNETRPSGPEIQSSSPSPLVHATLPRTAQPVEGKQAATPVINNKKFSAVQPVVEQEETIMVPPPLQVREGRQRVGGRKSIAVGLSLVALGALAFGINQFATSGPGTSGGQNVTANTSMDATGVSNTVPANDITALQEGLPLEEETEKPDRSTTTSSAPLINDAEAVAKPNEKKVLVDEPSIGPRESLVKVETAREKKEIVAPAAAVPPENKQSAPDLTDQIYLRSNFTNNELGEGVFDLSVSLDNKSDKLLKTVAVNVIFTDNDGKNLNKQTIYFSNVKPGETMTRPASQHKLAKRVLCELGLVSSEGLLFYAN